MSGKADQGDKVIMAVHGGAGGGSAAEDELRIISDFNRELPIRSAREGGETKRKGITAYVIDAGMGQAGEFPDNVKDNIAFIKRGESNFLEAAKRAEEAGAKGLLISDDTDDSRPFRPGMSDGEASIPVAGMTQADGQMLLAQLSEEDVQVNLKVDKEVYREGIHAALKAGKEILNSGGDSDEAVEAAINELENSSLFNAGKGAVFNDDGSQELDAAIMRGKDLKVGSVTGSKHAKNPITLARTIMEEEPDHIMLSGDAADWFGKDYGVEMVTQDYYYTQKRWDSLMRSKGKEETSHGTVGAVASDQSKNLASATSTGGLTGKRRGRIGDSPTIGAGTYANNKSAAMSATGTGEVFMRGLATGDISALIQYKNTPLAEAADEVIHEKLDEGLGGTGGVIALDKDRNFTAPYSTTKMVYGYITEDGKEHIILSPKDEQKASISAKSIKDHVKKLEKDGEFYNYEAACSLITHLNALIQYEKTEQSHRIVEHTKGLKQLLDHQLEQDLITKNAFDALIEEADNLIDKWQITFNSQKAMEYIKHLSVDIGERVAGSDEEKEAANYIEKEFERLGYSSFQQEFDFGKRRKDQLIISNGDNNSNDTEEMPLRSAKNSPETDSDGVTGRIVDADMGQPGDFPDEVEGNIALMQRGDSNFLNATKRAEKAGAKALLIAGHEDELRPFRPGMSDENAPIPVAGITHEDKEKLKKRLSNENVEGTIKIQTLTDQTSQNVIAIKKPKGIENPDIVYVTAHLDTVPFAPGANDNASGTAAMLEIARTIKDLAVNKEVRFITFGHEENGLEGSRVGSKYYLSQLSENENKRSIADFQMDMVAADWEKATALNINVTDGQPNQVWQSSKAAADKLGISNVFLYKHGSSDHESFYDAGIDSANISWRVPGTADLEPYYHSPHDTIEHISSERLQTLGDLVNTAVSDLVRR